MNKYLLLILLELPLVSIAQTRSVHSFFQLSSPEKVWVMTHFFIAKKAWDITLRCRFVTDSLQKKGIPDRDPSGGRLDAFRHSFWMATLTEEIGGRKALSLGRAHEKGNYLDFKRNRFEEGELADKAATDMDLFNNKIGSEIGDALKGKVERTIVDSIIKAISLGKMLVVLKDSLGRACDSTLNPIPKNEMYRKWVTARCLVPSDR